MMKKFIAVLCALGMLCASLAAWAEPAELIPDYAGQLQLNMASETAKTEATVKTFVDGDTVHFHVPADVCESGMLKARFLALNTPESTGKIEEYGKAASRFTREKLESAVSIIIESDTADWTLDSTGDRHLVWVWYQTAEGAAYRNLNLEILQNGLARANSTANNRYGSICSSALDAARTAKLKLYSGQKDPDFYYGDAVELDLKELRTNPDKYNGMKVAFNGVVTLNSGNAVYVEALDEETGLMFGMSVYYGFSLSGKGLTILNPGNEVRIVGSMQYYEAGGTWQVSDLTYRMMKPKDPGNIQQLSEGHSPAWTLTDAAAFAAGEVRIVNEDGSEGVYPYAQLALGTSVEMHGLTVVSAYTTNNEDSSSNGAITLVCQSADGHTVHVRTVPLTHQDGTMVVQDEFLGKTINVKGIVDFFDGTYQVKVFMLNAITVLE